VGNPAGNDKQSAVKLPLLALSTLAGLALCWSTSQTLPQPAWTVGLAVGALLADWRAARLPGAGSVSVGFVFALLLALRGAPGLAALLTLLGLATTPGSVVARLRTLEFFVAALPRLASLGVLAISAQPLAACFVYCVLAFLLPDALGSELGPQRPAYAAVHDRLLWSPPTLCAAALVSWDKPAELVAGLLLLLAVARAQAQTVHLAEKQHRHRLQEALHQASETQQELLGHLHRSSHELRILEVSSAAFLQTRNRLQTAEEIVKLCSSLLPVQSAAVLLAQDAQLLPAAYRGPSQARLQGAALAGMSEAAIVQAWQSRSISILQGQAAHEQRIFPDEPFTLAVPLGAEGVLYLGRRDKEFSENEVGYVRLAAFQASLGLSLAHVLENLSTALSEQQRTTAELRVWNDAMNWLLHSSPGFLDKLDRQVLSERLQGAVQALFPGATVSIYLGEMPADAQARQAVQNRLPLLLEGLLCVPVLHAELPQVGLIEVRGGTFNRLHQDILSLLAGLAGVAWKNAELHREKVEAQAQLLQSSKMAAVGQLAAGLAHELNTPLGSISLNLDMAKRALEKNPAAALQRLEKAGEMVERSRELVNGLLFYSRQSSSGRQAIELRELVDHTLQVLGHALRAEGVEVQTVFNHRQAALANHNEIQQVLFNLLLNAKDAMRSLPAEQRRIMLATRDEGETVQILVRDSGPGVPEALRDKIWDPFFTTKEIGTGTGLGLSVSQQIVAAHEGTLVLAAPSEFRITLPAAKQS
jgi:signal transduction histidine kinase